MTEADAARRRRRIVPVRESGHMTGSAPRMGAGVFFACALLTLGMGASAGKERVLGPGQAVWFYLNASELDIGVVATGATLSTTVNGKILGYHVTLPDTGAEVRIPVAWNLPAGPQKIAIRALSGTVDIRDWYYVGGGAARMVAGPLPMTVVYGDSIAAGRYTGGGDHFTGGWADQIAPALNTRVANMGLAGSSAACWGAAHTGRALGQSPTNAVVVAFGTNDMLPGKDGWGCNATIDTFRTGMDSILSALDGLSVPVYVSAILPTTAVSESTRSRWNEVVQEAATAHMDTYIDPSSVLDRSTDYTNATHPNQQGHDKLAQFWAGVLTA